MAKGKILTISAPMHVRHVGGFGMMMDMDMNGAREDNSHGTGQTMKAHPAYHLRTSGGGSGGGGTSGRRTEVRMRSHTLPSRQAKRRGLVSDDDRMVSRTESLKHVRVGASGAASERQPGGMSSSLSSSSPPTSHRMSMQPSLSIRRKEVVDRSIRCEPVTLVMDKDDEKEKEEEEEEKEDEAIVPEPISKDTHSWMIHRDGEARSRFASNGQPMPISTRPKRQDSGLGIECAPLNPLLVHHHPHHTHHGHGHGHQDAVHEGVASFKDIQAMHSLQDRLAMYKRSRDYWANADPGLLPDWTRQSNASSHMLVARV